MIDLENRTIDEDGNVIYNVDGLIEYIYNVGNLKGELLFHTDEEVDLFNKFSKYYNTNKELRLPTLILSHEENQKQWFMPEKYNNINLDEYFLNLVSSQIEIDRVKLELQLYRERGMENVLKFCIYFMDFVNENNIVIGVGRGSSCASYLLFLIKLHLVNSIKYNLDIREFLK